MYTRQAGKNWTITTNSEGQYSFEAAHLAVLMDLRDELREIKQLLRVLRCPDFLGIPRTLHEVRRNTAKPKRRKARKGAE